MKVNVISIGNSKGIRIPRAILEQCNQKNKKERRIKVNFFFRKLISPELISLVTVITEIVTI